MAARSFPHVPVVALALRGYAQAGAALAASTRAGFARAASALAASGLAASALVGCALIGGALVGCGAPAPARTLAAPRPATPPYAPTEGLPGAVHITFQIPRGEALGPFDLPWPTDLLRTAAGRPDLRGFPGREQSLIADYLAAAEEDLDGFSVSPTIYLHLDAPIDAARLASKAIAPSVHDPVFLVDVDPLSPDRGALIPLLHRHYPTALRYVPAGTLAVRPRPGLVLRGGTSYAVVVRRDLGDHTVADPLGTPRDLELLKWTTPRPDPVEERARALHGGAFDRLAAMGVPRVDVAAIALFRTQIPEAVTARMIEVARALPPARAPRIVQAEWLDALADAGGPGGYLTIRGVYCTPNFQSDLERAPFLDDGGGTVRLDAGGRPVEQELPERSRYRTAECGGQLRARFVLTIPDGAMPAAGFPLALSAHGTGGDAYTFLGRNDFAGWAAREGIAVVSTDQPLHGGRDPLGGRPGSREPISISIAGIPLRFGAGTSLAEFAFYNPFHPGSARDNLRQASVDGAVLARLIAATDFGKSDLLPRREGRLRPHFDATRVMAVGHSQGSQSAVVLGAIDPLMRGALLSGCGGDARLGILGRHDIDVQPLATAVLGLAPGELDAFHPFLTLVQTLADPIDPQSYARFYWEPPAGRAPRPVLHYEGLTDTYTPPITAEALAVALHLTPIGEPLQPVLGLGPPAASLDALLAQPGPARGFLQYRATRDENGHFVLYYEPGAADLARRFLRATLE